jgi:hypothetical protein
MRIARGRALLVQFDGKNIVAVPERTRTDVRREVAYFIRDAGRGERPACDGLVSGMFILNNSVPFK